MLKMVSTALVCMMLQAPALAASEEPSWYKPNQIMDHNAHPNFYFLLGDWESSDPSVVFKESWNTIADGDLFCVRSYPWTAGGHCTYDLIVFQKPLQGLGSSTVQMRRIKDRLTGNWSAPVNHRGEISFYSESRDLVISNKYDSPDQNTVNLQIETTSNGVTTSKTLVLKRSAPTKIDPRW